MADVAVRRYRDGVSEAAQMAVVRDFSRRTTTSSSSTIIINKTMILAASEGVWQPRELELSDPLAQPPCVHVRPSLHVPRCIPRFC